MHKALGSILVCCFALPVASQTSATEFDSNVAFNVVARPGVAPCDESPSVYVMDEIVPERIGYDDVSAPLEESLSWNSQQARHDSSGRERWIDRVTDPISRTTDIRFRQKWNWPEKTDDPDTQELQIRPTIPYTAWGQLNLLRISVPYNLRGPDGAGLGNIQLLDLVVFEESWGRWGVGPSLRLAPDTGEDNATFQIGPAAGAVTKNKHWTIGVLTQNFLSGGVSESRIQPILAHKFDRRWAIGIGQSQFRYDWKDATWTQLPLGLQVDKIADINGQKVKFFLNPQYNFERDSSISVGHCS